VAQAQALLARPVAVAEVEVYVGHFVDQIRFVLTNGTTLKFGPDGGSKQESWVVPTGEWVTWVKVRQGGSLDSVQFFTNRGSGSPQYGGQGGKKAIFHVARGNEIISLVRDEGAEVAPPLIGIGEKEHDTRLLSEMFAETAAPSSNIKESHDASPLRAAL
jgi:hypothetical protein